MKVDAPPCKCGSKRARRITSQPFRLKGRDGLFVREGLKCQNCGAQRTIAGRPWPGDADV